MMSSPSFIKSTDRALLTPSCKAEVCPRDSNQGRKIWVKNELLIVLATALVARWIKLR